MKRINYIYYMKKMIKYFIVILLFMGCGRSSLDPLPPVVHYNTFQECIDGLQTPFHTALWLRDFTVYDLDYNLHWGDLEPDQAYTLAESLWDEWHNGKSRGVCGQFAAVYVVAAREHGYKCGGYVYWTATYGHAQGWIEEHDGQISITDNLEYWYKVYPSYQVMKKTLLDRNSENYWGYFLDERFQVPERGKNTIR